MKNIKNNLFKSLKTAVFSAIVGLSVSEAQGVFITEIADPNNDDAARFVELYNSGTTDMDLANAGYKIQRWTNGNDTPTASSIKDLVGVIPAGGFHILVPGDGSVFQSTYGFAANQVIGNGGAADSNGDDQIAIINSAGDIIDIFGVPGEDGTGTPHEFEDGRAERVATVTSGSATWIAAEWNVDNDAGDGDGPQDAPSGFDPGSWIGSQTNPPAPNFSGDWKLAPVAGALSYGPADGSAVWWSNSQADVETRACLFDDKYKFEESGAFTNELGDQTWLESWQSVTEGCGTPIAPHDGSNAATWSYSETDMKLTLSGVGAFIGLAKSYNGGELQAGFTLDDVPSSITYDVASIDSDAMSLKIDVGGGVWTFSLVRAEVVVETINLTFNLDMSSVDAVSDQGVHIAGGGTFGGPGDNPLLDADGDGIYSKTFTFPVNGSSYYTYLNGGSDWGQKENIAGQDCANPDNFNDRFVQWGTEDVTVNACFALCGDGSCSELTPPTTVEVVFSTDASDYNDDLIEAGGTALDVIHATGSFEGWSGYGVPMTDADGDGIYVGSTQIIEGTTFEYKYIVGGWGSFESGAELNGPCDFDPSDGYNNYGATVGTEQLVLPTYVFGGGCAISTPQSGGIVFTGSFGGALDVETPGGGIYTNPTGAESWAGFANEDASIYPFEFPFGGVIHFKASSAGADAVVNFKFEYMPSPNVDPSFSTEAITISGSDLNPYHVEIPPQGSNTYSSFLLYVQTLDVAVTIIDVEVMEHEQGLHPGVFFSEYAEGTSNNKYIEIFNSTGVDIDLSAYSLSSCSNGCDTEGQFDFPATVTFAPGTIVAAGDVYVVCHGSASNGISAECDQTFTFLSNGDDFFALTDAGATADTYVILDKIGDFGPDPGDGWDVAGVTNATKDYTLVRKYEVMSGNQNWPVSAGTDAASSEWMVEDKPSADFTPPTLGSHSEPQPSFAASWKLAPVAGALRVGPNPGAGDWWSSSADEVNNRACLFDDKYEFHADGVFENVLGDQTWNETWQDGVDAEGCGAPVAPHDGSNAATWSYSETDMTITISGVGAFLGIAKAITGGEMTDDPAPAVPDTRVYNVLSFDGDHLSVSIPTSGGFWTFDLIRDGIEPEMVDITFNLDMSSVDAVSDQGVHIAGGASFGGPGDNPLLDADGDGIYSGTFSFPVNGSSHYTYLNGGSDWGQKENIAGQDCADESNWNDRFIQWGTEDITVNACFALCGDGNCSELTPPPTVEVVFSTDANEYNDMLTANGELPLEMIYATGSFEGWSGYGVQMTDEDGDGIYVGAVEMLENTAFEYKYVVGGWGNFESGAELGGPCDWNPLDTYNNYGAYVGDSDVLLPTYIFGGGCRISGEPGPEPGIIFSGPFGGAIVTGETYLNPTGSQDWAGFANENTGIYPFSFPYGGSIAFEAFTAGADVDVYFRFEYNPFPDVEPSFNTQTITISGTDPAFYEVPVPALGDNTYSSFLLYVVTRDAAVTLRQVEVIEEDSEQYVFSDYSLEVFDAASYNGGTVNTLPDLDVEADGIVVKATFDLQDPAPYIGAMGIFWDANFNGVLDEGDLNILEDFDDDYYYDDYYNSREHENDEPSVAILIDNEETIDSDPTEGVFVAFIDDLDFMEVQGATFFFAELDPDLVVTGSTVVKPFSSSPIRFTGIATEMTDQALPVEGVFVEIGKDEGYYYNDYYYYDTETLTEGITAEDGTYDIGVSADDIVAGDVVRLYPYHADEDNGGRLVPLIGQVDETTGDVTYGNESEVTITDGTSYVTNISVMKLNTLVQGFAYGIDGQPLSGYIWVDSQIGSDDNPIGLYSSSEIGDNGYYSFWAQNGTEINVFASFDGGPFVSETFFLDASTFDDGLGAYVYNYNIDVTPPQATGFVEGYVFKEYTDDYGNYYYEPLEGAEVVVYNDNESYTVNTGQAGYYMAEVPAPGAYFVAVTNDMEGYSNYDFYDQVFVTPNNYTMIPDVYFFIYIDYYMISGYVYDDMGQPLVDATIDISSAMMGDGGNRDHDGGWYTFTGTDSEGYYSTTVPEGVYDIIVMSDGFFNETAYGVDVSADVVIDFTLSPVGGFTGSVQGVVSYVGEYDPYEPAFINVWNDTYSVDTYSNDDGFYSIDLIDGVYNIYVGAPGYDSYYMEEAFEISGNTVTYDVELFEYGFAGPPQMVDLHDVANDQGRQMRAVWDAGMPGDWGYFTQFSIWRKVNNAPIELWDYIETVPWHGMDPYAAVVPTLGDSSMHGMHMSTFMVTAHTEDVGFWLDSEPMSGYSIDNLHPEAPMSLAFSTNPGAVSLTWSGPVDDDFSYFNIYRQDILTNDPAMVFTTTDSFYIDQELSDVGAYEYWVTAVDISGLESDASSIVSAVLSAEEKMGMPTEFALKQNYPNPFNPSTQIQYALPSESRVVISIYDLTGRKVRTLVNEVQSAGHRSVMWNATNEIGRPVSAGMYIYTIQAGDFIQNRKMVLMK